VIKLRTLAIYCCLLFLIACVSSDTKVGNKPVKIKPEVSKQTLQEQARQEVLKELAKFEKTKVQNVKVKSAKVKEKVPVIVIDPGHGGVEEGAKGVGGALEKEVVLKISLLVDQMLRKELKVKTLLTRTEDVDVPLEKRTKFANDNKADLFISVHANASVSRRGYGVETYYLDNTNDRSSQKLAKRENASVGKVALDDLSFILSDLIQNAKLDESISLAHNIQNSLTKNLGSKTRSLGVKKAPFYVLVGAHMPCVLVEVSFIDHPKEGKLLVTDEYQYEIARSLVEGVKNFLAKK